MRRVRPVAGRRDEEAEEVEAVAAAGRHPSRRSLGYEGWTLKVGHSPPVPGPSWTLTNTPTRGGVQGVKANDDCIDKIVDSV